MLKASLKNWKYSSLISKSNKLKGFSFRLEVVLKYGT